MFAQLILDIIIILLIIWGLKTVIQKQLKQKQEKQETPISLRLKIKEVEERQKKLEELQQEVTATCHLVEWPSEVGATHF